MFHPQTLWFNEKYFRKHARRYQKNMPTAIGVYWWFWRRNFDLKFVIVIPVTFWATLYHYTHLFQSLYNTEREREREREMRQVALGQGAGHQSESDKYGS